MSELAISLSDHRTTGHLTQPGVLMGTPRYMAPEQYCSEPMDQRTDQFSFCVALFEALYGQRPFAGETLATLCYNVISGTFQPPPPSAKVPNWLRLVLMRGLQHDREKRYPDMDALINALRNDPRRRLLRIALALLVVVGGVALGAVVSANLADRGRQLCRGAEQKLAGVWDGPRRQAARAAVEAAAGVDAGELWSRIEAGLDDYTGRWVAMHTEACLATHSRGEQSPQLLDLRMRCLGRRLQEVAAFTDLLQTANRAAVEQAVAALSEFPPLATCADPEALSAPQPPPEEPGRRAEVERLYRRLSEITAQERFGRYAEVLKDATALAQEADRLGYQPLAAEAWFALGNLQNNSLNSRGTSDALFRAALAGIAGHNLRIAAHAFTLLAAGAALEEHYAEARQSEQLASAALTAVGGDQEIRARLINATGLRAMQQRQLDEALRLFNEALALREHLNGPVHPGLIQVLGNLALVRQKQGRFADAMALRLRALHISELQLGPWHPRLALALHGIGHVLKAQGALREAKEYYERALRIEERALGPGHPRVASTLRFLGPLLIEEGAYDEAGEHLRRALAITRAQQPADADAEVRTLLMLALALRYQDRFDDAIALQEKAVELRTEALGARHARVGSALVALSQTRLLQKDYAGALRDAQQAVAIVDPATAAAGSLNLPSNEIAEARVALGRALLALGRGAAALSELEAALARREAGGEPIELGAALVLVADSLIQLKRPAEALPKLARALQLRGSREPATERMHADAYLAQAKALLAVDRAAGTQPVCARAQAALSAARSAYTHLGAGVRRELAELAAWSLQSGCSN